MRGTEKMSEEYDEEIDEELEESITGYYPKSGSYVVEDRYDLAKDGNATLVVLYEGSFGDDRKLDSASFTLIRSFKLLSGEIEPQKVLIEGQFRVAVPSDPRISIRPTEYYGINAMSKSDVENLFSSSEFSLTDLYARPLPTVIIKGKFEHQESKRHYEIKIKAFLTQDFPGLFFSRPLKEVATYNFVATDATIRPLKKS